MDVMTRIPLLNGCFDALTLPSAVDQLMTVIRSGSRGYVCTVNVAILMMMRADPRLQGFADRAAMVLADGQPLIWVSRLLSTPLPERVAGIDLIEALCQRAQEEAIGVYLLGASRETVELVASRLAERYPTLKICGAADGYFSPDEERERTRAVADSGAQILFVGMGVPRQEYFLEERWEELGVGVAIGVGGSFDVIAGHRMRAPAWIQRLGFEWLFRLAQEPWRLWKRYATTNWQFLRLVFKELLFRSVRSRLERRHTDQSE